MYTDIFGFGKGPAGKSPQTVRGLLARRLLPVGFRRNALAQQNLLWRKATALPEGSARFYENCKYY